MKLTNNNQKTFLEWFIVFTFLTRIIVYLCLRTTKNQSVDLIAQKMSLGILLIFIFFISLLIFIIVYGCVGFYQMHIITINEMSIKASYPPMEKDPISKLRIMHPITYSGKNHMLLNDHEYNSTKFYKTYGNFTLKNQCLHVYNKPKFLLKRSSTEPMYYTSMFLLSRDKMTVLIKEYHKKKQQKHDDKF